MYYRQLKGVHIDELYQAGEYWFNKHLQKDEIYIQSAINEYFNHKKLEHLTIFVSGSMLPLLKPLGKYLDVDFILCTKLLLDKEDRLTGEIGEPQTIGNGKKESIIKFSYKNNINLKNSFAYGDDISDIQMLESTGNPICIGNNKELIKHAEINNWKTII
ncbi:HAD family hydrolase [Xenorhabdus nematophila]|nr:HAD-IB family phosphatase [Xenorhabdus nematophila]